jgi:hypothetical protein
MNKDYTVKDLLVWVWEGINTGISDHIIKHSIYVKPSSEIWDVIDHVCLNTVATYLVDGTREEVCSMECWV